MIIERMKINDYEEVHKIWSGTNGITLRAVDDSKKGIDKFLKRNPDNNYVCRINGKIVGGILCGHDGRKGFIYHTVVIAHHRGKGIGKKLLKHAVNSLKKEDITKIAVLVDSDNILGNDFWQSRGFEYFDDLNYRIMPLDECNI